MININTRKAVFFDFGDTLVTTEDTYPRRIETAFARNGYRFDQNDFINAYLYSDYEIFKTYREEGAILQKQHQNLLYRLLVKNLGIKEDYMEVKSKVKKTLGEIEYERVKIPGCDELLELLRGMGLKLAIISNNDGHTTEKCEETGIDKYFDIIIDSTREKMVKPDRNIFSLALKKLGLDSNDVIHVGDLYGSDIMGAINAGIEPVWINHRNAGNYENLDIRSVNNLYSLISLFS